MRRRNNVFGGNTTGAGLQPLNLNLPLPAQHRYVGGPQQPSYDGYSQGQGNNLTMYQNCNYGLSYPPPTYPNSPGLREVVTSYFPALSPGWNTGPSNAGFHYQQGGEKGKKWNLVFILIMLIIIIGCLLGTMVISIWLSSEESISNRGEKSAMMEEVLVRISEATTTATESGRKVLPSPEEITLAPELMGATPFFQERPVIELSIDDDLETTIEILGYY